jgi:hypothetical protein
MVFAIYGDLAVFRLIYSPVMALNHTTLGFVDYVKQIDLFCGLCSTWVMVGITQKRVPYFLLPYANYRQLIRKVVIIGFADHVQRIGLLCGLRSTCAIRATIYPLKV